MYSADLQISDLAAVSRVKFDSSSTVWDWINLLKPRVVALVMFTGLVGLLLAPGHLGLLSSLAAILAIVTGAGAAGAINMWFDRDVDSMMRRTLRRPIPTGKITASNALAFGLVLASGSIILMLLATNLIAAASLMVSIGFYVIVYTMWLKRRTPQNIVIGGAAGAFPPIIGWLAVTGSLNSLPLLMFSIVFFWTPPHFWALSLYACGDYREAAIPMLPVAHGQRSARLHILWYTIVLVAVSLIPWISGQVGALYGVSAVVFGAIFIFLAYQIYLDQDGRGESALNDLPARRGFKFSLFYLFMLFLMFTIDWVFHSYLYIRIN